MMNTSREILKQRPSFLTASWQRLAIANYVIDPALLLPYLPAHTEIDLWKDKYYISLVGFLFLDTKVKSLRIFLHSNFEEVNLRFYVRHLQNGIWKRGVTFISEFVPKPAIAFVANSLFGEKYQTLRMQHKWTTGQETLDVEYRWKKKTWNSFSVRADLKEAPIAAGSEEEFITEHYWGYTKLRNNITSEYGVEHPRWNMHAIKKLPDRRGL